MLGFNDIEASYDKWVKYVNEFEEGAVLYDGFNVICSLADICDHDFKKNSKNQEREIFRLRSKTYFES
jgi:hypothetical protein